MLHTEVVGDLVASVVVLTFVLLVVHAAGRAQSDFNIIYNVLGVGQISIICWGCHSLV